MRRTCRSSAVEHAIAGVVAECRRLSSSTCRGPVGVAALVNGRDNFGDHRFSVVAQWPRSDGASPRHRVATSITCRLTCANDLAATRLPEGITAEILGKSSPVGSVTPKQVGVPRSSACRSQRPALLGPSSWRSYLTQIGVDGGPSVANATYVHAQGFSH
jgi:hypothetical protein